MFRQYPGSVSKDAAPFFAKPHLNLILAYSVSIGPNRYTGSISTQRHDHIIKRDKLSTQAGGAKVAKIGDYIRRTRVEPLFEFRFLL